MANNQIFNMQIYRALIFFKKKYNFFLKNRGYLFVFPGIKCCKEQ